MEINGENRKKLPWVAEERSISEEEYLRALSCVLMWATDRTLEGEDWRYVRTTVSENIRVLFETCGHGWGEARLASWQQARLEEEELIEAGKPDEALNSWITAMAALELTVIFMSRQQALRKALEN